MSNIHIKRVYAPASEQDGLRILVDRLWPRGVTKAAASLDLWAKDVAPTSALRTWFGHRPDRFTEFERRYRKELQSNPALGNLREFVGRSTATLLFGAKDLDVNHAAVLARVLEESRHSG